MFSFGAESRRAGPSSVATHVGSSFRSHLAGWDCAGSRRRTMTSRGCSKVEIALSFKYSRSFASLMSAPGRGTTNATSRWPKSSSGTPITAWSATSGCSPSAFSTALRVDVLSAGDDHVVFAVETMNSRPASLEVAHVPGVRHPGDHILATATRCSRRTSIPTTHEHPPGDVRPDGTVVLVENLGPRQPATGLPTVSGVSRRSAGVASDPVADLRGAVAVVGHRAVGVLNRLRQARIQACPRAVITTRSAGTGFRARTSSGEVGNSGRASFRERGRARSARCNDACASFATASNRRLVSKRAAEYNREQHHPEPETRETWSPARQFGFRAQPDAVEGRG